MFLFILETIGTQELVLIGVIALIFLGPRKLPQMAKTIGKTLREFKGATSEFRETWEREANFEEELKAFKIEDEEPQPVARDESPRLDGLNGVSAAAPEIREIDKERFDRLKAEAEGMSDNGQSAVDAEKTSEQTIIKPEDLASDKRSWL